MPSAGWSSRIRLAFIRRCPFGEPYAQAGTTDVDVSFTGQNQDTASGAYDFPGREYSTQGRWPSPDPFLGSMVAMNPESYNRYAYVLNDPLNRTDPTGFSGGSGSGGSGITICFPSCGGGGSDGGGGGSSGGSFGGGSIGSGFFGGGGGGGGGGRRGGGGRSQTPRVEEASNSNLNSIAASLDNFGTDIVNYFHRVGHDLSCAAGSSLMVGSLMGSGLPGDETASVGASFGFTYGDGLVGREIGITVSISMEILGEMFPLPRPQAAVAGRVILVSARPQVARWVRRAVVSMTCSHREKRYGLASFLSRQARAILLAAHRLLSDRERAYSTQGITIPRPDHWGRQTAGMSQFRV